MLLCWLLVLVHIILECYAKVNNCCNTFQDYTRALTSDNCFYNPDNLLETPQLIERYIGNVETYEITTDDGYILTLFRIPRKNPKGTILLQHPLTVDGRIWVSQGNGSFAFYLWRAHYDIWLSNMRGTLFSQKHINLTASDLEFWNFSFHEVGYYDLPAQIKFIKKVTRKRQIIYVGHSEGSTAGLVYGSSHFEDAKFSIKTFIFMATPCYFNYTRSPLTAFRSILPKIETMVQNLKLGNVLSWPVLPVTRVLFRLYPRLLAVSNLQTSFMCGWTPHEANPVVINFDVGILIKNFSWKTVLHYAQLLKARTKFQMYDYGKKDNLVIYNSEEPPAYPIEDISVPIMFVSSANDSLTALEDTELVLEKMSKKSNIHSHMKVSGLNHVDYMIGKHIERTYFAQILNYINSF